MTQIKDTLQIIASALLILLTLIVFITVANINRNVHIAISNVEQAAIREIRDIGEDTAQAVSTRINTLTDRFDQEALQNRVQGAQQLFNRGGEVDESSNTD